MDKPDAPHTPGGSSPGHAPASASGGCASGACDRRDFLTKAASVVIGGTIVAIPAVAGLTVFLDPLRRKSEAGASVLVANLNALPESGEPRKFSVLATRVDAWNRTPNVPIGAVYLQRLPGNKVRALNVVCPHAGCFVDYRGATGNYFCPCHNSSFAPDGKILDPNSPSPRGLDELPVEVRRDTEVWVTFQNFRPGVHEKNPRLMKAAFNWLDNRTGYKKLVHESLFENVPGGARWRYVWGSTLVFCFVIQVITGTALWFAYSPSFTTAWESVYYIQHEMAGGWFLRGLHHYTAHAMTVLLVIHLMQVIIDGAYKAPREMNFWSGVVLLCLVLSLSLTGYLLPWDQKGYWATKVATSIAAITPLFGPAIQKLVVGGSDYGHHTLTRFFALHAGVIPGLIIAFIVGHIYLFRKHGITPKLPKRKPDAAFWPDQVLRDAVACLAVLAVVLFLIFRYHGAELGAPADPSEQFSAARPEWYFLFLFELLKYFPGGTEVWGAIVIPGLLMLVLAAMPFIGNWKLGHRFNIAFMWAMLFGVAVLTGLAWRADRKEPNYAIAVASAHRDSQRVIELAQSPDGIPATGAVSLLRNDALTQGPKLFAKNCASCHRYDGHDALGGQPKDKQSAPDLKGFAGREWLTGFLDPEKIDTAHYYGGTKFKAGKMVKFTKTDLAELTGTADGKKLLQSAIAALSAEAQLKSQKEIDARDETLITEGTKALVGETLNCMECHKLHEDGEAGSAPDLTGYGSREWMLAMVGNPKHERFFGERNDRMPAFGEEKQLTPQEISLVVDWLRGEWYVPKPR